MLMTQVMMSSGDWAWRLLLTLVVLLAIALTLALMRRGWRQRGARQTDIAANLAASPPLPEASDRLDVTRIEARYLGANRAGDWLDRIVVHGLGVPSPAAISVRVSGPRAGVWVERVGAPDLFLLPEAIGGVRHDRAVAARAFEHDGVLIVTCSLGAAVDIGLRIRNASEAEQVRLAVATLMTVSTTSGDIT